MDIIEILIYLRAQPYYPQVDHIQVMHQLVDHHLFQHLILIHQFLLCITKLQTQLRTSWQVTMDCLIVRSCHRIILINLEKVCINPD